MIIDEKIKLQDEVSIASSEKSNTKEQVFLKYENYIRIETEYAPDKVINFASKQIQKKSQKSQRSKTIYDINKLNKLYKIDKIANFTRFLIRNENIASLLLNIYEDIRQFFPAEEIILKLVSDPDISETEELFAYILTSLSAKEAVERLEELEDKLLSNQLDINNGIFTFNLRFL